jgi:hypothetical protein
MEVEMRPRDKRGRFVKRSFSVPSDLTAAARRGLMGRIAAAALGLAGLGMVALALMLT